MADGVAGVRAASLFSDFQFIRAPEDQGIGNAALTAWLHCIHHALRTNDRSKAASCLIKE
jgi:hypothetical protein